MQRDFKGIWIPKEIWMSDLSCAEKCLWAEIHSLTNREKGGCFASNEYLMEFMGVKERRLQEMLANLKQKGFLIEVGFNGRQRIIRALVPEEIYESDMGAPQRCGKVHPWGAEKCTPAMQDSAPPPTPSPYISYNKDESNIYIPPICPPKDIPSPSARKLSEQLHRKILDLNPNFTEPIGTWPKIFEKLLKKKTEQYLMDLINWTFTNDFWKSVIVSAKSFEKNIAKLESKQQSEKCIPQKQNYMTKQEKEAEYKRKVDEENRKQGTSYPPISEEDIKEARLFRERLIKAKERSM